MNNDIFNIGEVGTIRVIGENTEDLPMWAINRYISEFCNNYNKIIVVQKICMLLQNGYHDDQIYVAKRSAEVLPDKNLEDSFSYSAKKFIVLGTKKSSPDEFWHIVFNYVRPVVFVKDFDGNFYPLLDFDDIESIKITQMSYNSPVKWDIRGAINGILDIANANNRKNMEEADHIASQIEQGAKNYIQIARASQIIGNPRTPQGVQVYATKGLDELLEKQAVLNERLGIRTQKIDQRG